MRSCLALLLTLGAAACSQRAQVGTPAVPEPPPPAPVRIDPPIDIRSADELVAAMHNRYVGKWYRNLTFMQKSTFLRADSTPLRVETWYEAGIIPGRLRIDLGEPARGNGVLYRGDSAYQFQNGRITDRRIARNPLLILGFDVYGQPPARTLEQLRAEGIKTEVLRTDSLYGRPMFVVGAAVGDSTSNQFWIDAERMLFVRLLLTPAGRPTLDIRFEKYVPHAGGWVAEEVRMFSGGRLAFLEEYSNVRVNVRLDENLFVPEMWSSATHWYSP